jgi:hypothetical protein
MLLATLSDAGTGGRRGSTRRTGLKEEYLTTSTMVRLMGTSKGLEVDARSMDGGSLLSEYNIHAPPI